MVNSIAYFSKDFINGIAKIQNKFFENPEKVAELVYGVSDELQKLGVNIVKEVLENADECFRRSSKRKQEYYIEKKESKQLITTLGTIDFEKTLFSKKENRKEMLYLVDELIGFNRHQRMAEDAVAAVLQEAVQTSYQKGGNSICPFNTISKEVVKDLIHSLEFPQEVNHKGPKKVVETLYIDADEDHASLQFQEHKGDLEVNEYGRKKNGLITKLVYVYEGVELVAPKSKRHRLVNPHYFCRVTNENEAFWDEIYEYINAVYDVSKIKNIYVNADGGAWIKAGMKRLNGVTYVLDEFHLSKYLLKLTGHMKDTQQQAKIELCEAIKDGKKKDFEAIVNRLVDCAQNEKKKEKIKKDSKYILNNWRAAKKRLQRKDGIKGCSAEGHVSHVLSKRMNTLPMGWSRLGAAKMAQLREWYYNKKDFLELAYYQKTVVHFEQQEEMKKVAGDEVVLSASEILLSESTDRTKLEKEYGKYSDAINHTWSLHTQKQLDYYSKHWNII